MRWHFPAGVELTGTLYNLAGALLARGYNLSLDNEDETT